MKMLSKPKRLIIYKILVVLFTFFLFFMPNNISILPDMDLRVIISSLGLDYQNDEYVASAQVLVPDKSGTTQMETASGNGSSVAKAVDELQRSIGKKANLKQCALVVVGKSLAEKDVIQPLGFLLSSGNVSPGAALVFSEDAKKFIEDANSLADSSGTGLNSFVLSNRNGINLPSITLLEALSDNGSVSGSFYLPEVIFNKPEEGDKAKQEAKQASTDEASGGGSGGEKKGSTVKSLDTAAVINKGVLLAKLEPHQTRGITWLEKSSNIGFLQLDDFVFEGKNYGTVPARLKRKSVKVNAKFVDGKPTVTFKIKAHCELIDKHIIDLNPEISDKVSEALDQAFMDKIKNEITLSFEASKQHDSDFMQLKTQLNRYNNKELREFNLSGKNLLNEIQLDFKITVRAK